MGGAIYAPTNSNITVHDSNLNYNTARVIGGAISGGHYSNILVQGSNLTHNNVTKTSSITYGGAIFGFENSVITVQDSNITHNNARRGGAVGGSGNITVIQSNLNYNNANNGSAVWNNGAKMTISNTNFTNNNATVYGGIYGNNSNITVTNTTFANNYDNSITEKVYTGGIYGNNSNIISDNNTLIITSDSYDNLYSYLTGDLYSNVTINLDNNITLTDNIQVNTAIKNLTINGNSKTIDGNGQYQFLQINHASNTLINNITITNCTSTSYGGVIYAYTNSNLTVTNTNLTDNNALSGGAIYVSTNSNLTVIDSNFTDNNANQNGGAIYVFTNSTLTIYNSNFTGNNATLNGGAIYGSSDVNIHINKTVLSENTARYGGAIFGGRINISNSSLVGNNASVGGAISNNNSVIYLNDTLFENNTANMNIVLLGGGAIFMNNTLLNIDYSSFKNNKVKNITQSSNYGGAILIDSNSTIFVSNSNFTLNNATSYGGAIYAKQLTNYTIINSNFTQNYALFGGGIYVGTNSTANISQTKFLQNSAHSGGGLGSGRNSTVYVNNSIFLENDVVTGSGITANGILEVNNSYFMSNNDGASGGGIYLDTYANATIDNSIFENNTYMGVYVNHNVNGTTILNSNFTNNKASNVGGAVRGGVLSELNIINCNFINNTSNGSGGGTIYGDTWSKINVINSNITNSSSPEQGGAIRGHGNITIIGTRIIQSNSTTYGAIYGTNITIKDSLIENCTTEKYGGIISPIKGYLIIENSNFTNNYINSTSEYIIRLNTVDTVIITDSTFINNTDNNRDMLFSNSKSGAQVDIHNNTYIDNCLAVNMTQLDNISITTGNSTTFNYPVNVTLARGIYNGSVVNGTVVVSFNDINNNFTVINNDTTININNTNLTHRINEINYSYITESKHYQNITRKFTATKNVATILNMTFNTTAEKVAVGDSINVTVRLTDDDGNVVPGHEISVLVNEVEYINNITDENGLVSFEYVVPSYTVNNVDGQLIFTAQHRVTDSGYLDSSDEVSKILSIDEISTYIHLMTMESIYHEGSTLNVTVVLYSNNTTHIEDIVGETVNYNITTPSGILISEGSFNTTIDGYNITVENLPTEGVIVNAWFNGNGKYKPTTNLTSIDIIPERFITELEVLADGDVYVFDNKTVIIRLEDSQARPLSGEYIIHIQINDEEEFTQILTNGELTLGIIRNLSGLVNIKAHFNGTENYYSASNATDSYNVTRLPTQITNTITKNKVGNTTFNVSVVDQIYGRGVTSGTIRAVDGEGNTIATGTVTDGTGLLLVTSLSAGEYKDLTIVYDGLENVYINSSHNVHPFNVEKTGTNVTVEPVRVNVTETTATIVVNVTDEFGNPLTTGTVNITVGNQSYNNLPVMDGQVTQVIDNLLAGTHTINTTFNEDDTYAESNNISSLKVELIGTVGQAQILDKTYGNVTIQVNITDVDGNPVTQGNITVYDGDENPIGGLIEQELINGTVTITIPTSTPGELEITIHYNENNIYSESNATDEDGNSPIKFTVDKIPTITTLEVLDTGLGNVTIRVTTTNTTGKKVTTGNITILDPWGIPISDLNEISLVNGAVDVIIPSQNVGQLIQIIAHYNENDIYGASNATGNTVHQDNITEITVTKMTTTTHAEQPENNSIGHIQIPVTITDINNETVTEGTIIITDNTGKELGRSDVNTTGKTLIPVTIDTTETTNITITYTGTTKYNSSEDTLTITPEKQNTKINVTDNKNGTITINITTDDDKPVPEVPVNVTLPNGTNITGTTDENGTVNITIPLPPGEHNITVSYPGNDTTEPANKTVQITIPPISTQLDITTNNGTNTQTSVDVELKDEEGNPISGAPIIIKDNKGNEIGNGTTDENGKVNIPVIQPTGTNNITVTYPGNETYKPSNATVPITTNKHNTTINVTDNKNGTITVNITDDDNKPVPEVPVNITLPNGTNITVTTDENGTVNITIPLPPGEHNITVSTPGDENNNETNKTTEITIPTIPTQLDITVNNETKTQTSVDVELKDEEGNPISGAPIIITDNKGNEIGNETTDENGTVNIKLDLPLGDNNITVTYPGNNTYSPKNETIEVNVTLKESQTTGTVTNNTLGNVTIDVEVVDPVTGEPVTGPVNIIVDGEVVGNGTLDEEGRVTIPVDIDKKGNYTIIVEYEGNDDYEGSNYTIDDVSIVGKDVEVDIVVDNQTVGNTTVNVTITDPETDEPISNGTVIVTLPNGTTVNGTTDENGTVTIPIDVPVGDNNITIIYPGDDEHEAQNETITINVTPRESQTTGTVTNNTLGNVTIDVQVVDPVTGEPVTGPVKIIIDDEVVGNGTLDDEGRATIPVDIDKKGNYTIIVEYLGNDNYNGSTHVINDTYIAGKDVNITIVIGNQTVGNTTINVTITDPETNKTIPNATVIVTLPNGTNITGITDENGTINISIDVPGENNITITYPGDDEHEDKQINTTVKVKSYSTVIVDSVVGTVLDNVTFTANVVDYQGKPVTGGYVVFKVGGKTLTDANGNQIRTSVVNGIAKLSYVAESGWIVDSHPNLKVEATYSGTSIVSSNRSDTSKVTIYKRNATVAVSAPDDYVNGTLHIDAVVKDQNGSLINDGLLVFKLNGLSLKDENNKGIVAKVVNGKVHIDVKLPFAYSAKKYNLTATYSNKIYNKAFGMNTTSLKAIPTYVNATVTIKDQFSKPVVTGQIYNKFNNAILEGTAVINIKFDGISYAKKVKINNGTFRETLEGIPIYKPGTHKIEIAAGANSHYDAVRKTITSKATPKYNVNTVFTNITRNKTTTRVQAKIVDDKNKNVQRDLKITIKLNGKSFLVNQTVRNGKVDVLVDTSTLKNRNYTLELVSGANTYYNAGKNTIELPKY